MPLVRHKIKRYGWVPDTPDQRDHLYAAPVARMKTLARRIDLRRQCPRIIYDQGQLGSCTGNAEAGLDAGREKLAPPATELKEGPVFGGDAGPQLGKIVLRIPD